MTDPKNALREALAALPPVPAGIPYVSWEPTPEYLAAQEAFDAFMAHPAVEALLVEYAEACADEEKYVEETVLRKEDFNARTSLYWQDPKIEIEKLPEELQAQWWENAEWWEDWFREAELGVEVTGLKANVSTCPHCGGTF